MLSLTSIPLIGPDPDPCPQAQLIPVPQEVPGAGGWPPLAPGNSVRKTMIYHLQQFFNSAVTVLI